MQAHRVLVTGSRDWRDPQPILDALLEARPTAVLHGDQRGADRIADRLACELGLAVLPYPADFRRLGPRAGPLRNHRMLKHGHPHLVLAFPLPGSRGTWHMVRIAREAGVPVRVHESRSRLR